MLSNYRLMYIIWRSYCAMYNCISVLKVHINSLLAFTKTVYITILHEIIVDFICKKTLLCIFYAFHPSACVYAYGYWGRFSKRKKNPMDFPCSKRCVFGHGVGSVSSHARHARYNIFLFIFPPLYIFFLVRVFFIFYFYIINRTVDVCGR